jgi:hypothetical protein
MTIGMSAISSGGSRKTAGSMKTIAGVNALFLSVWTGKSWAAAAADPKMAKISHPSVSSERRARLGTIAIAPRANRAPRKIFALFESWFSVAATDAPTLVLSALTRTGLTRRMCAAARGT